jgi:hypothetical protein
MYNPRPRSFAIPHKTEPTIRIKRLRFSNTKGFNIKIKGASAIQNQLRWEKEKAGKALKLNSLLLILRPV